MTALCGGGASRPKTGVAETLIFSTGALASLLNNKGGAWATLAAPLLGVLSYDALDLCQNDPPAAAQLTADEYTALLQLQPWDTLQTALGKLAAQVTNAVWYQFCECSSTTTPAQPASVLQPPPGVSPQQPSNDPCFYRTIQLQPAVIPNISTFPLPANTWKSTVLFPELPTIAIPASGSFSAHNAVDISGLGWTSFGMRATKLVAGAAYCSLTTPSFEIDQWTGSGTSPTVNVQWNYTVGSGSQTPIPLMTAINTAKPALDFGMFQCGTTPDTFQVDFWAQCGGTVGGPVNPCAADPAVLDLLGQIMQLLLLVQRQGVPFGSVGGAVHTGLTGNGSIAVQGLLGARIELTTVPGWIGLESGSPNVLFEAGWVNWQSPDGYTNREFLGANPLVTYPPVAGVYTALNYSLAAGVVATITEIRREF